jgi:hypothetical protein
VSELLAAVNNIAIGRRLRSSGNWLCVSSEKGGLSGSEEILKRANVHIFRAIKLPPSTAEELHHRGRSRLTPLTPKQLDILLTEVLALPFIGTSELPRAP